MDLPKNITQIGVQDAKCKIYVEDYVVSFLKQLNPIARDKTMAAALYGKRKTEEDKTYLFVYGAGKLDFLQKETRHLSQAQHQEIERIRKQYFREYEFLGYRILNGEMVDGFYVCEQDVCRFVSGYTQFYENNEAMLTYMLESRQGDATPESVDSEKYDMVRDRQEKRRAKFVQHKKEQEKEKAPRRIMNAAQKKGLQVAAVAFFVLALTLGVAMKMPKLTDGILDWEWIKTEFMERKLPEAEGTYGTISSQEPLGDPGKSIQAEVVKTDDHLAEAILSENRQADSITVNGKAVSGEEPEEIERNAGETELSTENTEEEVGLAAKMTEKTEETGGTLEEAGQAAEGEKLEEAGRDAEKMEQPLEESGSDAEKEEKPEAYIVCQGDTLTGISIRIYGNEKHVDQICQLNQIKNPDEIQIGQKILLP